MIYSLSVAEQERFWRHVTKTADGCWLWTGAKAGPGYGVLNLDGRMFGAHRVSWVIANGAIPERRLVCHSCDVKLCVRPDHLFIGTQADNMADYARKGLAQLHPRQPALGSRHGNAVLTETLALEIWRRFHYAGETQRALATAFGVSRGAVQHITKGESWKHVTDPKGRFSLEISRL